MRILSPIRLNNTLPAGRTPELAQRPGREHDGDADDKACKLTLPRLRNSRLLSAA
jgi:hypothetical protein